MRTDRYGYRQGVMFAQEMLQGISEQISLQPIIDNLERSLGNKPASFAEGVRSIIAVLRGAV
jgi:hypothetical protein